jgi:hypothetical protein
MPASGTRVKAMMSIKRKSTDQLRKIGIVIRGTIVSRNYFGPFQTPAKGPQGDMDNMCHFVWRRTRERGINQVRALQTFGASAIPAQRSQDRFGAPVAWAGRREMDRCRERRDMLVCEP